MSTSCKQLGLALTRSSSRFCRVRLYAEVDSFFRSLQLAKPSWWLQLAAMA